MSGIDGCINANNANNDDAKSDLLAAKLPGNICVHQQPNKMQPKQPTSGLDVTVRVLDRMLSFSKPRNPDTQHCHIIGSSGGNYNFIDI